jgi:hypothetical protein
LDRIPAGAAHFVLAVAGAALMVGVKAVLDAGGVTGISDWGTLGRGVLDAGAVAAAGLIQVALLGATKLTTSFGRGSGRHAGDQPSVPVVPVDPEAKAGD